MKIFKTVVVTLCLSIGLLLPTACQADYLPPGFIKEFVVNVPVISGTWVSNPRNDNKPMILLVAKSGKIRVLEDPDNSEEHITIVDLGESDTYCDNGERAVQSALPHPEFETNAWLYLFYSYDPTGQCLEDPIKGAYNIVARFTMDKKTLQLDLDSKKEIWRGAPTTKQIHNGKQCSVFCRCGDVFCAAIVASEMSSERSLPHPFLCYHFNRWCYDVRSGWQVVCDHRRWR